MSDSISDDILDILAKHSKLERDKIALDTHLRNVGVDSLVMVEIIFDLEERFDISIPDPDFIGDQKGQFETAADVVKIVKELIEQQIKSS